MAGTCDCGNDTSVSIKLHNVELKDLYCSPNIVRVIKSRRVVCAGHVARMGERRCIQGFGGET